jgi:hypothetical protein
MHGGAIGSVLTLSLWTPPGLNDFAVSARPAQTWPLVSHHPQLKDRLSFPDQRKPRRRMGVIRSFDVATGSGPPRPGPFSSSPS